MVTGVTGAYLAMDEIEVEGALAACGHGTTARMRQRFVGMGPCVPWVKMPLQRGLPGGVGVGN